MTDSPLILVIEDEASLTTLLRYNLESHGFRVATIENGGDAMVTIAKVKPNLLLLDWMLPGVSGIEICRKIRRDPETHNLPVILLTARGEERGPRPRPRLWRRRLCGQALRHRRAHCADWHRATSRRAD